MNIENQQKSLFKENDYVVIKSKTSIHNGKIGKVLNYTPKTVKVALINPYIKQIVTTDEKCYLNESSLKKISIYDIIRNMSDKELKKLINKEKRNKLKDRLNLFK